MANARNNAKSAISKAQAKAPATEPKAPATKDKAPAKAATDATDPQALKGMLCKVVKGTKYKDETLKVFFVSKGSERRDPVARAERESDGKTEIVWIKPAYLEIVGTMTEADAKRLVAVQEAEQHETLYVEATAFSQTDNGVTIKAPNWFKRVFFTLPNDTREGMISTTGKTGPNGLDIFEVVAWKIKKDCGLDSYNAIKAVQPALAAIVEAKS